MSALVGALAQELVKELNTGIHQQTLYVIQYSDRFNELEKQMKFMQSFVADASRKKDNQETTKTTIAEMQELIYEADDLVVDCQIRADYQEKKGRFCFLSPSELWFRLQTGKKLARINSEIEKMQKNLIAFYGTITAHAGNDQGLHGKRWSSQVFDRSEIVGLEKDTQIIKEWILNQTEPLLHVGIVGMGGLGKTTLAKKIYNDSISTKRYQQRIWVSVSQNPSVKDIMRSMLKQLGEKEATGLCEGDMLTRIRELLSDNTYLIVLDDVWNTEDGWWGQLSPGLPRPTENKNCIIVTSRNRIVVDGMGVQERVHEPELLKENESWELFCKVAKISSDDHKSLLQSGQEIVKKCGGLPLAIKTIGGMLSINSKKNPTEWERINKNFHSMLTDQKGSQDGNMSIIPSLQLSYDELPAGLKPCLLCFSIYPEDREIDVDQLIHWWVGEGFVRGKDEATTRELALNCFSELIGRCLVEVAQTRTFDGTPYTCKVHDMVRDLTIKIAREEQFCSFDEGGKKITNSRTRRLAVGSDTKFQALDGNSKLRALLLTATDKIGFNRNIELANVHSLRVLDLSKVKWDYINVKDFWEWVSSLRRLAYLNLREVAKLSEVPDSIGKLWGLQVLILEECRCLKELPPSIVTLPRLIFLNVGNCPLLKSLPHGFSRLSKLQEMYGFKIAGPNNSAGSRLGELKDLTELRVLQIEITEESRIQDEELQVLEKLHKLKLFSINAGDQGSPGNDIITQLGKLSPPPCVEELYLKHYLGETLPGWINPRKLSKLQYFCMEHSRVNKLSDDFLCVQSDAELKWDVKGVCLKFCQRLQLSWKELQDAMPEIRYLEISQCNSLQNFPCDVAAMGYWPEKEDDKEDVTRRMLSTKTIDST